MWKSQFSLKSEFWEKRNCTFRKTQHNASSCLEGIWENEVYMCSRSDKILDLDHWDKFLILCRLIQKPIKFSFGSYCYVKSRLFQANKDQFSERGGKKKSILRSEIRIGWGKMKAVSQELNLRSMRKMVKISLMLNLSSVKFKTNRLCFEFSFLK